MWLFFALLTPVFWSLVHVIDSHCVDQVFEKPWMGVITSGITTLGILLFIPFLAPFFPWGEMPSISIIFLAISAGILIQLSQLFYFYSLSLSEAGIVAAYWNFTPALLPIVSFFLYHELFQVNEYLGIIFLVVGSVLFCLVDSNLEARWSTFLMMMVASILQVAALLVEDHIFDHTSYISGFSLISVGLVLAGISPLLWPKLRAAFKRNTKKLSSATHILFGIEFINLCALASSQKAISLGSPSLVAAVETSVPAYTFIISILLLQIYPKFGDPESLNKIGWKILLALLMVFGVFLVQ